MSKKKPSVAAKNQSLNAKSNPNSNANSNTEIDPESRVHIRRCHVCSEVTESEGRTVNQCHHCGKHMSPFYFFNEAEVPLLSDFELRPVGPDGHRNPIRGFTAFW